MQQVLKVGLSGKLEGLDFKENGFNLKQMGKAEMTRATDIGWDEELQGYTIELLQGSRKGSKVKMEDLELTYGKKDDVVTFCSYQSAVSNEVKFINKCVSSGESALVID